jgi:rhamnose utilization protein RhaD (predicted bifunctional aldolase and dehydrogenase)
MAIPNYTYLKLKMPGPVGIITVGPTYRHAYECDVECVEYAEELVDSEALITDVENLAGEVPDPKKHTDNFEPAEAIKTIPLDPSSSGQKTLRVRSQLEPK